MRKQVAVWVRALILGATLSVLSLAAACGNTGSSTGSGETHFLMPCSAGTCPQGLECLCGVCSQSCESHGDCSGLATGVTCATHDGPGCEDGGKFCDVQCESDADCSDVSDEQVCERGLCRVTEPEPVPSKPKALCDSCGESSCAAPGECSLDSVCSFVDCGSALVAEDACVRPPCERDSDCANDERCATGDTLVHYACVDVDGACKCESNREPGRVQVCSPVELAGPRGDWDRLVVGREGPCEGAEKCATERTFWPNGNFRTDHYNFDETRPYKTVDGQLSPMDLAALNDQLQNDILRHGLATGSCQPDPGLRFMVELRLEDGTTMSNDLASCLLAPDYRQVHIEFAALVERY